MFWMSSLLPVTGKRPSEQIMNHRYFDLATIAGSQNDLAKLLTLSMDDEEAPSFGSEVEGDITEAPF